MNRILVCCIDSLDHRVRSDRRVGIGIPSAGVAVLFGNCRDLRQRLAAADGVLRDLIAVSLEGHGVLCGSVDGEGGVAGDGNHIARVIFVIAQRPGCIGILCVGGQSDCSIGGLFDQRDIIQVAVLADELDRPILGVVLEERGHDQRVGVLHEVAQTGHIQVAILAAPGEEALTVGNIPCVVNGSEVTAEVDRLNAHGRLLSLCEAVLDVAGHCLIFRRHGQIAGDGLGQVSVPLAVVAVGFGNRRNFLQRLAVADSVLRDLIAVCHEGHGVLRGSLDHECGVAGDGNLFACFVLRDAISVVHRPDCIGILCIHRQGNLGIGLLLDQNNIYQNIVLAHELDCPVLRVLVEQRSKGEIARVVVNRRGGLEENVALLADPAVEGHAVRHAAGIGLDKEGLSVGDGLRRRYAGEAGAVIADGILLRRIDRSHDPVARDDRVAQVGIPHAVIAGLVRNCRNFRQRLAVADSVLGDLITVSLKANGIGGDDLIGVSINRHIIRRHGESIVAAAKSCHRDNYTAVGLCNDRSNLVILRGNNREFNIRVNRRGRIYGNRRSTGSDNVGADSIGFLGSLCSDYGVLRQRCRQICIPVVKGILFRGGIGRRRGNIALRIGCLNIIDKAVHINKDCNVSFVLVNIIRRDADLSVHHNGRTGSVNQAAVRPADEVFAIFRCIGSGGKCSHRTLQNTCLGAGAAIDSQIIICSKICTADNFLRLRSPIGVVAKCIFCQVLLIGIRQNKRGGVAARRHFGINISGKTCHLEPNRAVPINKVHTTGVIRSGKGDGIRRSVIRDAVERSGLVGANGGRAGDCSVIACSRCHYRKHRENHAQNEQRRAKSLEVLLHMCFLLC